MKGLTEDSDDEEGADEEGANEEGADEDDGSVTDQLENKKKGKGKVQSEESEEDGSSAEEFHGSDASS